MPERSAPTLRVLAANSAMQAMINKRRGTFLRSDATSPRPVTMPMRAHMICTAAISGQVSRAVQRRPSPNCAPAIEYVAMPDGSSSAAPVTTPGPSASQKRPSVPLRRTGR
jgi:hypothetical protein